MTTPRANARSISDVLEIGRQLARSTTTDAPIRPIDRPHASAPATIGHSPKIAKALFDAQSLQAWYLRSKHEIPQRSPPLPRGTAPSVESTWPGSQKVYTEPNDGAKLWVHPANFNAVIIRIVGTSIQEDTLFILIDLIHRMEHVIAHTPHNNGTSGNAALYVMAPIGIVLKRPTEIRGNGNNEFSVANVIMGTGLAPYGMVNRHYNPRASGAPDTYIQTTDAPAELMYAKWVPAVPRHTLDGTNTPLIQYKTSMLPEFATSVTGAHCYLFTKTLDGKPSDTVRGVILNAEGARLRNAGGSGDLGETLLETVVRECQEEIGIMNDKTAYLGKNQAGKQHEWYHHDTWSARYATAGAQQWVSAGIGDQHHTFSTIVNNEDIFNGTKFLPKSSAPDSKFIGLFDMAKMYALYVKNQSKNEKELIAVSEEEVKATWPSKPEKIPRIELGDLKKLIAAYIEIVKGTAPTLTIKSEQENPPYPLEKVSWSTANPASIDELQRKLTANGDGDVIKAINQI